MGFDIRENVSPFFFIIKYVFNMANINKIRISGTSYDIQDSNATKVVNITQAEYDALPASAKTANVLYNITDAETVDFSQYWTSAETQSAITEATSGKVSTSDFNTYSGSVDTALNSKASQADLNTLSGTVTTHTGNTTIHVSPEQIAAWNAKSDFSGSYNDLTNKLSAGTNITIVDNVISATGGGGGGGEVSSAITSGDTNAVAGGAVFDAVVYSGNTYNTELTFNANGYAENWIVGQSAITIDVSGLTYDTRASYNFENSNGNILGRAEIQKNISPGWSSWSNHASNCTITTDGDTATTATITDIPSGTVKVKIGSESNPPKAIISGDTPETWIKDALDEHRDNTTIHITAAERSTWNNKSNFSGSYNDLTNKPIPDSALTSYSTNAVQSKTLYDELRFASGDTSEVVLSFDSNGNSTNYPNNCRQLRATLDTSLHGSLTFKDSNNVSVGTYTIMKNNDWYDITNNLNGSTYEVSNNILTISYPSIDNISTIAYSVSFGSLTPITAVGNGVYVPLIDQVVANTASIAANTAALANKQDTLIAGENITISGNVISAEGGGGGQTYTAGDGINISNDVISVTGMTTESAFTAHTASTVHMTTTEKTNLDSLATNIAAISGITSTKVGNWDTASTNSHTHSNKTVLDGINSTKVSNWDGAATNASNAVTALGGLSLVKLTQTEYDNLQTKNSNTLYIING